jgi:hypothetical protein
MRLSKLELDLIVDLAADTYAIGCALLRSWIARGWIEIAKRPYTETDITNFDAALDRINELGGDATRFWEGAPCIDITESAIEDLPWLKEGS